jgi:hypothetical protein
VRSPQACSGGAIGRQKRACCIDPGQPSDDVPADQDQGAHRRTVPGLTHDGPWGMRQMTHEAMLVEATIGTRNGYGEVTIGAALGVAPAVRLTFAGRHAPSITFEYVEPGML